MKVVLAYIKLHPGTLALAQGEMTEKGDQLALENTAENDSAYFEAIAKHWAAGRTFVLLEQDKLPHPPALRALHDCPHLWCTYPVPMAHNGQPCDFVSLSCTKFSGELMARYPDLMAHVGQRDMGYGLKHWNRLDMAMALEIGRRIGDCHWHEAGRVGHEHQNVSLAR